MVILFTVKLLFHHEVINNLINDHTFISLNAFFLCLSFKASKVSNFC